MDTHTDIDWASLSEAELIATELVSGSSMQDIRTELRQGGNTQTNEFYNHIWSTG